MKRCLTLLWQERQCRAIYILLLRCRPIELGQPNDLSSSSDLMADLNGVVLPRRLPHDHHHLDDRQVR